MSSVSETASKSRLRQVHNITLAAVFATLGIASGLGKLVKGLYDYATTPPGWNFFAIGVEAFEWAVSEIVGAAVSIIPTLFSVGLEQFLYFDNPRTIESLNAMWFDVLPLYFGIVSVMLFVWLVQYMLIPQADGISVDRIFGRVIQSVLILVFSREIFGLGVILVEAFSKEVYSGGIYRFEIAASLVESFIVGVSGLIVVAFASWGFAATIVVSAFLFYFILALRMVFIYVVYALTPLLLSLWVVDVGIGKYGKTLADYSFRIAGVLLISGIAIAGIMAVGAAYGTPAEDTGLTGGTGGAESLGTFGVIDADSETVTLPDGEFAPRYSEYQERQPDGSLQTPSASGDREVLFRLFMYIAAPWAAAGTVISFGGVALSASASTAGGAGGGKSGISSRIPTGGREIRKPQTNAGVWSARDGDASVGSLHVAQTDDGRILLRNPSGGGLLVDPSADDSFDQDYQPVAPSDDIAPPREPGNTGDHMTLTESLSSLGASAADDMGVELEYVGKDNLINGDGRLAAVRERLTDVPLSDTLGGALTRAGGAATSFGEDVYDVARQPTTRRSAEELTNKLLGSRGDDPPDERFLGSARSRHDLPDDPPAPENAIGAGAAKAAALKEQIDAQQQQSQQTSGTGKTQTDSGTPDADTSGAVAGGFDADDDTLRAQSDRGTATIDDLIDSDQQAAEPRYGTDEIEHLFAYDMSALAAPTQELIRKQQNAQLNDQLSDSESGFGLPLAGQAVRDDSIQSQIATRDAVSFEDIPTGEFFALSRDEQSDVLRDIDPATIGDSNAWEQFSRPQKKQLVEMADADIMDRYGVATEAVVDKIDETDGLGQLDTELYSAVRELRDEDLADEFVQLIDYKAQQSRNDRPISPTRADGFAPQEALLLSDAAERLQDYTYRINETNNMLSSSASDDLGYALTADESSEFYTPWMTPRLAGKLNEETVRELALHQWGIENIGKAGAMELSMEEVEILNESLTRRVENDMMTGGEIESFAKLFDPDPEYTFDLSQTPNEFNATPRTETWNPNLISTDETDLETVTTQASAADESELMKLDGLDVTISNAAYTDPGKEFDLDTVSISDDNDSRNVTDDSDVLTQFGNIQTKTENNSDGSVTEYAELIYGQNGWLTSATDPETANSGARVPVTKINSVQADRPEELSEDDMERLLQADTPYAFKYSNIELPFENRQILDGDNNLKDVDIGDSGSMIGVSARVASPLDEQTVAEATTDDLVDDSAFRDALVNSDVENITETAELLNVDLPDKRPDHPAPGGQTTEPTTSTDSQGPQTRPDAPTSDAERLLGDDQVSESDTDTDDDTYPLESESDTDIDELLSRQDPPKSDLDKKLQREGIVPEEPSSDSEDDETDDEVRGVDVTGETGDSQSRGNETASGPTDASETPTPNDVQPRETDTEKLDTDVDGDTRQAETPGRDDISVRSEQEVSNDELDQPDMDRTLTGIDKIVEDVNASSTGQLHTLLTDRDKSPLAEQHLISEGEFRRLQSQYSFREIRAQAIRKWADTEGISVGDAGVDSSPEMESPSAVADIIGETSTRELANAEIDEREFSVDISTAIYQIDNVTTTADGTTVEAGYFVDPTTDDETRLPVVSRQAGDETPLLEDGQVYHVSNADFATWNTNSANAHTDVPMKVKRARESEPLEMSETYVQVELTPETEVEEGSFEPLLDEYENTETLAEKYAADVTDKKRTPQWVRDTGSDETGN